MKSLAPGFLIATPTIGDPRFDKAVVLMLEHNEQGSMGLVLTQKSPLTLKEVALSQDMPVGDTRGLEAVFLGGPVDSERGFLLHTSPDVPEREEVLPGVYLSVTLESLRPLLKENEGWLRFCLGYSGWGPGQMEKELSQGAWLFNEASSRALKDIEPEWLWEHALVSMGVSPMHLLPGGGVH